MKTQINDIDGALWGLILDTKNETIECETTVYKFVDKVVPIDSELGFYRYHILTFKPDQPESTVEFMQARIGDVSYYIDNLAKAGYNGLMVKHGCVPKKTIKNMIKVLFKNFSLPNKQLKSILKQV